MRKKVLIIDTSILCVYLGVAGKETCGPENDKWDKKRVDEKMKQELEQKTTIVLPLATILETGNHISQSPGDRYKMALALAKIMADAADNKTPWAAFTDQSTLWSADKLKELAAEWPNLATQKLSIGDATIKTVAEYYAEEDGRPVEIFTGDQGLKSYEPVIPPPVPRRRKNKS
jgi:hypothetical protein